MREKYDDDPLGEHEPELTPDVETHNELRPCPFCGSDAEKEIYFSFTFNKSFSQAKCTNTDCEMSGFENILVKDWNTRPIEDALIKERDEIINQVGILSDENAILCKQLDKAKGALREIGYPTRPVHYDLYQSIPIKDDDEIARDALAKIEKIK